MHRWLGWILLLGLGLRCVAACGLQYQLDHRWHREFLIEGDASGYWELARSIANGEPYAIYTPPRKVLRMPGFPALLALSIRLFGDHKLPARLLLACLCSAGIYLNFLLGRELKSERAGLIAAAFTAISPVFVAFTPVLLSESSFAVALLGCLYCGVRVVKELQPAASFSRSTWIGWAIGTGVTSALAVYLKPSWILAVPVFSLALIGLASHRRQAAVAALLVVLSMVLTLLPWGLRNHRATGHFTLTTLWMGPSLYDGLNPNATGDSNMEFFDRDNLLATMSEYEVDQHYRQAAKDYVLSHPGHSLQLAWAKLIRYWKPWPNAAQFDNWPARIATSIAFIPLMLLAAVGLLNERRNLLMLLITLGPILYFSALHCIFVSSLRYRLPAEYPLMVLSAAGLLHWWPDRTQCTSVQEVPTA